MKKSFITSGPGLIGSLLFDSYLDGTPEDFEKF